MKVIINLFEINATLSITASNMNSLNKLTRDRDYWNDFNMRIKKLFF